MSDKPVWFNGSQPILRVDDLERSVRFYVDMLGFTSAPWGTDVFTSVSRDRACIYLARRAQGDGRAWAYVAVDDVDALHAQLVQRGVPVRLPPTNFSWALEMHVEDPDGNVLRIGSDPHPDDPIADPTFL